MIAPSAPRWQFRRGLAAVVLVAGLMATGPVATPALAAPESGTVPAAAPTRRAGEAWTIDTVAGTGQFGYSGDGGPARSAQLNYPLGVAKDPAGNLYISDAFNQVIRRMTPAGIITTVAGTGKDGYNGDGIPATEAMLNYPVGIDVDAAGNIYIADSSNNRIRRVSPQGIMTTVAGSGGYGYSGDGGPATEAEIAQPQSVTVDGAGNLYIADWGNNAIRKVDPTGIITTVAGTGEEGYSGDGGPATEAMLRLPSDMALDPTGNLYIVDWNNTVRKVDTAGIITTVAGTGETGYGGDDGPATAATFNLPSGIEVQGSGVLYIADYYNEAIRRIDTSGIIDTVAGMGSPGYSGDGGYGPSALLSPPSGLELDAAGSLYIADSQNNVIRRLITSYLWIGSAPEPTEVGSTFTYDVSVSGLPARTPGSKGLTMFLPREVAFVSMTSSQGRCTRSASDNVHCRLGTISPGTTARVSITVTARVAGIIPISAMATGIPAPRSVTAYTRISAADCGRVISADTRLRSDIGPCAGDGVVIRANDITFDLGGHRIFGFPGPGTGNDAGIRLPARERVTVRNGTVSDFDAGVFINLGRANTVTAMTIRDNVGPDDVFTVELGDGIVVFDSPANRIVGNTLNHNGVFDGIGVLGEFADDNIVEQNIVENTVGPLDQGPAGQGIIANAAGLAPFNPGAPPLLMTGTVIRANTVRGSGSSGIASINNLGIHIVENIVTGNGMTNYPGNGIGIQVGFRLEVATRALVQGNEVHGNGFDGIQVQRGSSENRILDNDAADNNARHDEWLRGFDLHDLNLDSETFAPSCDANIWDGNIWGLGYYNPPCAAEGGSGPAIVPEPEIISTPSCYDQFDNDQDGLVDYEDPDCQPTPEGPEGDPTCTDGIDNDGDTVWDGDDPDCQPPRPETPPGSPICYDGHDNDRDGLVDYEDPDCIAPAAPAIAAQPQSSIQAQSSRAVPGEEQLPPIRRIPVQVGG